MPFKKKTVTNARTLVAFLARQGIPCPDISPNPHGTIALEWENDQGYAYVEVGASQWTALVKTADRQTVFSCDRGDATDDDLLLILVFALRAMRFSCGVGPPLLIAALPSY